MHVKKWKPIAPTQRSSEQLARRQANLSRLYNGNRDFRPRYVAIISLSGTVQGHRYEGHYSFLKHTL